ncbi:MFS transporter [Rhodococcus sp. Eu-32]|uniref:MFS transporter n=1 Tax=Rhodococcus sp. Eu-32 TaxID=1017319 RepID=UPI001A9E3165|nr:MFS transporter [Rhodococcus sp. Eu-32]
MIEGYDNSIYAYMAVFLAPVFFPSEDSVASLLSTLLVFAVAYIARPFGGVLFGYIGDRVSRRTALMTTLLCMGGASTIIGLLPSHATIGPLAAVLLVLLRVVQGMSVGGEVAGAATVVSEAAPKGKRGRYGALNPFGATMGFALASATAGAVTFLTTDEQMQSWAWRIPFLLAFPLTAVCWVLRRSLVEHSVKKEREDGAKTPFVQVFKSEPLALAKAVGLSLSVNGTAYFGLTYLSIHLIQRLGYEKTPVYWTLTIVVAGAALLMLPIGRLADRIGLAPTAMIGLAGYLVLTYPAMVLMENGAFALVTLGLVMVMINTSFLQVAGYTSIPELFPSDIRYTGTALGWNIGVVIAGGTAPALAVWLIETTGSNRAPAFFVMLCAIIGLASAVAILRGQGKKAAS